ncbi:hypothetical protein HDV63DRAFT_34613 [Trichoderma sp. SZMC 28014]
MPGDVKEKLPATEASAAAAIEDDDEPDEWDKRIFSTGCADLLDADLKLAGAVCLDENMRMTDCYYEKKDWRACAKEMEDFKECWKAHGNVERTSTKDN